MAKEIEEIWLLRLLPWVSTWVFISASAQFISCGGELDPFI